MRFIRWVTPIVIMSATLYGIATYSRPTPKTPEIRLKPIAAEDLSLERSNQTRATRAYSRFVAASASTTTTPPSTTVSVTPTTKKPKSPPPSTAAPRPDTESAPEAVESSAYDVCYAAALARKGKTVAPNVARWSYLVERYFPNEVYKTCLVMACESGGNPSAVGPKQPDGSYPQGLMQILSGPFDAEENMKLAASMRADRGWQPWACK